MKKFLILTAAALLMPLAAAAGDITAGSVPGNINYQGRLERDNAPITGTVHLYFRIYNSLTASGSGTCGALAQPCLWESPEITVQAAQGIFSADMTPPLTLFGGGQKLYLEVQVEADVLTPREPLNSVAFALAAKRLEDGASVSLSTLSAAYQVLLATAAGSAVGVGTENPAPGAKMTVDGWLKIASGGIVFPDNTTMSASGVGSAGSISAPADAGILADSDGNGSGDVIFGVLAGETVRITNAGNVGIGTPAPLGKLDVNGALYVGNEGIYDRTDGELNVKQDLVVEGGKVRGTGNNYLSLGETANTIIAATNNTQRLWLDSSGNLGIGAAASASERVHSTGNIRSNTGVRGGSVSIGAYNGGWTGSANEVRADNNTHLLLQQTNPYNVGIGTDTPREKLHVHGSVRSDYGIIAATAAFSSDVRVNGTFTANSGAGNTVNLSSTVIYGTLQVTGGIGSTAGLPAYIASSNTFTGHNTFQNGIDVSSDILTLNRIGAGVSDFDFAGTKYLQIGDNKPVFANDNAMLYLVGGSTAEAKINFYRGATEAARLETQSGNSLPNLALVINNKPRTITDSVYHRIQNSVVWISTGYNTTPAIFVSSYMGNVGIGTSVPDPNWRLTVDGNIRIAGATSNALIFADGSSMNTANTIGSAMSISNSGDALVQADSDQFAGGDVILRAGSVDGLILKSGGNVGIGTVNPVSKLNIRGGDLLLGNPVDPYSGDSVEDLIVAGNIVFDGALIQRSASQVQISGLMVASDVYLSTAAGARTGIGTKSPATTLDANGSAQFGSGTTKSTFTASGVLQLAAPLSSVYGGSGANLSATSKGDLPYFSAAGVMGSVPAGTDFYLLRANGAGAAPTWMRSLDTSAGDTIVRRDGSGNFAGNTITAAGFSGPLTGNASTASALALDPADCTLPTVALGINASGTAQCAQPSNVSGTAANVTGIVAVANGGTGADLTATATGGIIYKSGAAAIAGTGQLTGVLKGNGSGAPSVMIGTSNTVTKWTNASTIGDSIITDDGTNVGVGVSPTALIKLDVNGKTRTTNFQMTSGAALNYVLTSDLSGNASWVNPASGGLGDGWVGNEITDAANATLTRSGLGTAVSPYLIALNLGNSNTWTAAQTFSGGLSGALTGNVTGNASGSAATVTAAAQPAITSVGTLTGLTMGGNVAMGGNSITGANNIAAATFTGALTGNVTGNVSGSAATVTAAAQPNITSVGTLTGLTVTAAISGSVTGSAATVTAAAQPNVTSVGTLTSLAMGGGLKLYSRSMGQLLLVAPSVGDVYFCSDCSPAKVVVATGTAAGNFADVMGGTFQ